ncbi:MAG: restriction endonuclease [Holophagales bacterium]|jgi:hypothetical protein|nr:restriction endonuclease [Holophagales bacterium]
MRKKINNKIKKNTGVLYEKHCGPLILAMIKKQEGSNIKICEATHNKKVKGLSTTHQIDYWIEYMDVNGNTQNIAVQTKDEKKAISQADILAFVTIVKELNCKGIFVTKTAYQRGAINVAKHYGIQLIELREPTDADYYGRLVGLSFSCNVSMPHILSCSIVPKNLGDKKNDYQNNECKIGVEGYSSEVINLVFTNLLYMSRNDPMVSEFTIIPGLRVKTKMRELNSAETSIEIMDVRFLQNTFLYQADVKMEIIGASLKYKWVESNSESRIDARTLIQTLYVDVLEGKEYTFSELLGIREREPLPINIEEEREKFFDSRYGNGTYANYLYQHPEIKKIIAKIKKKVRM